MVRRGDPSRRLHRGETLLVAADREHAGAFARERSAR
jgi:hypothetical protein